MTMPCEIVTQIHAKAVEAGREFRNAVALRDALLPKLISGDLWAKNAERSSRRFA